MAKFEFKKDEKKSNEKKPRPVKKTNISKPQETYDPLKATRKVEKELEQKRPVGRPKSGRKSYQTVRLLKTTVTKINALENALGIPTQDETVDQAIDRVINSLTTDEKRGYDLWLDMFKKKSGK
ncbi:DUF5388 domain-containing protein [Lactobacillus amylovorus]|uniref:DUF5388 domain-containing protein n=1 Tax=Lactobacillus amylovorus TaxID=1604 RepID=UPI003F9385D5